MAVGVWNIRISTPEVEILILRHIYQRIFDSCACASVTDLEGLAMVFEVGSSILIAQL